MLSIDSNSTFAPRHLRSAEIIPLLIQVNEFAGISCSSVLVYLEDSDYASTPTVAKDFHYPGLFLAAPHAGADTPQKVRDAITSRGVREFIWLSKTLLDGPVEKIVWVYAHELRHVAQKFDPRLVSSIAPALLQFQDATPGQQFENLDKPQELDSELFARRCVAAILGTDAVARHHARARQVAIGATYTDRLELMASYFADKLSI